MNADEHVLDTLLATAASDLEETLESIRPEVNAYMERLRDEMPKDDHRPMKMRHLEAGRLLQAAGLRYFQKHSGVSKCA